MGNKSNADIVREAYAKWDSCKGADLSMWDDYTTEDLRICSLGGGKHGLDFSCDRNGREQMHAYLEDLTSAFQMEYWKLEETVSEGNKVVGIGRTAWTHRASGRRFETPVAIVCEFRDGLMCSYREFYDTAGLSAIAN